jgi:glycosyltransferase involved in cell wall biosynthesis
MRIAQVAPLAESVPPKLYGGTERVISWLTEERVNLGHEVTLFASGDSLTTANLIPVWPRALRLGRPKTDPAIPQTALLEAIAERAAHFDIVHCHIDWLLLPLLSRLRAPFVTTTHGRLDLPGLSDLIGRFPNAPFISISENQRAPLPRAHWLSTIHHGLPINAFQPSYARRNYLVFLGRITAEKGPEAAIRIAKAAGMPLRIAAKIPRAEHSYFNEKLKPMIDDDRIQFIGEVNGPAKEDLLAGAAALLFPIEWPEPFGLVMIEAMACGTPVIAFRAGSVPEVVENGVTGFIVEGEAQAVEAVAKIGQIDRRGVRGRFEQRFTAKRMAEEYVRHYAMPSTSRASRDLATATDYPQKTIPGQLQKKQQIGSGKTNAVFSEAVAK